MAPLAALSSSLGRFEILAPLGAGGMGRVYLARDPKRDEEVALKLLRDEPGADARLRFRREFRAAQRLHHPRIVRVFECGEIEGHDYFTMEVVRGQDLRTAFRQQAALWSTPERLGRVLSAGSQIAQALAYLHGQQIVHRDLKPENILIDARWQLKVMDFGLARGTGADATRLTQQGAVFGSALYMAPEQAKGLVVDARADLYALGVILFELCAGRPPFAGDSVPAILYRHIHEAPPRLQDLRSDVPGALAQLVDELLAKDPADRPTTAAAVGSRLGTVEIAAPPEGAADTVEIRPGSTVLPRPRLCGRALARAEIARVVQRLVDGRGGLVLCAGDPGSGKSRLLEELRGEAAQRGVAIHGVAAHELPPRPFVAGAALVEQLTADLLAGGPSPATDSLGAAVGELQSLCPAVTALAPAGLAPGSGGTGERSSVAVAELARALATRHPLLWLVDDAHALDETSAAAIEAVARLRSDLPVLVVCAARTDADGSPERTRRFLRWIESAPDLRSLPTPALGRAELVELARSMLGDEPPDALCERLVAESHGNPRDAEEMVRALHQAGALQRAGLLWELIPTASASATSATGRSSSSVPEPIANLWQDRISRLDEDTREVLAYVAVLGRYIAFPTLRAVTGLPEEALLDVVDHLLRDGLLRTVGAGDAALERYVLANDRIRDVTLARLTPARRAALHRRVAEALALHASQTEEVVFELARHFDAAGDEAQAHRYHLAAADAASSRGAHRASAEHLQRAQELRADPDLRLRICEAFISAGDGATAEPLLQPLAGAPEPSLDRARARYLLARGLGLTGDYLGSLDSYLRALEDLGRPMSRSRLGLGLELAARVVVFTFLIVLRRARRKPRATEAQRLAVDIYRFAVPAFYFTQVPHHRLFFAVMEYRFLSLAGCVGNLADLVEVHYRYANASIQMFGSRNLHARLHRRRAHKLARAVTDRGRQARFAVFAAHQQVYAGELDQAAVTAAAAAESADRAGDPATALLATLTGIHAGLLAGDVPRVEGLIERARELLRLLPDRTLEETVDAAHLGTLLLRGRIEEAGGHHDRMSQEARAGRFVLSRSLLLRESCELARLRGDIDGAIQLASEAASKHAERGLGWFDAGFYGVVHAQLLLERAGAARTGAHEASRAIGRLRRPVHRHLLLGAMVLRTQALLALREGRLDRAEKLIRRAERRAQRAGAPMEQAWSWRVEAAVARQRGLAGLASQIDTRADKLLDELGVWRGYFRVESLLGTR